MDYAALRPRFAVPRGVLLAGFTLTLLLGGMFYWTLGQMWIRWDNPNGYYNHGPLVFPIAVATAWLIIRKNGLPMQSTRRSRIGGIALLAGAVLVHLASMYARITFVSGFMIPMMFAGMALYLGGLPMLKTLWFPIAFLGFMIPLPDITIYSINFHLKMWAAQASTQIVNIIGVPAFRKGSAIFLDGGKQLTVDDVCSGLRSLISLLAFAMLFTYACRVRGVGRLVLFLSAVPIAVLANVVRITVLVLVAHYYGVELSSPGGWVHDVMGFVVFVVAFCMLFLEEELLLMLPGVRGGSWLLGASAPRGDTVDQTEAA